MNARNNRLQQFFGGYFHQDWDLNGASWQEVVEQYLRENPKDSVHALREDLRSWLNEAPDRMVGQELANSFNCYYEPRGVGLTDRGWGEAILAMLDHRSLN